ncbi:MAG TPA: DedA family protein [Candidatus Omnitrophica bacterium]|nr:DedA family protein [Candidatus Omnitrophota bacterium]
MELPGILGFFMHFDDHLMVIIQQCGAWTYLVLFGIIFAETGLVLTPFLPGDSLLFVVGAFSAQGAFQPFLMGGILLAAAIAGDSLNYAIGKYFGKRLTQAKHIPFFKKEYLDRTHHFYKKYGGKTIILARFLPIVRTFAPFVAGIVRMDYPKFLMYNVIGGCVWILLFYCAGFYFGNIPLVKEHFSEVILAIIVLSVIPAVIEFLKMRKPRK